MADYEAGECPHTGLPYRSLPKLKQVQDKQALFMRVVDKVGSKGSEQKRVLIVRYDQLILTEVGSGGKVKRAVSTDRIEEVFFFDNQGTGFRHTLLKFKGDDAELDLLFIQSEDKRNADEPQGAFEAVLRRIAAIRGGEDTLRMSTVTSLQTLDSHSVLSATRSRELKKGDSDLATSPLKKALSSFRSTSSTASPRDRTSKSLPPVSPAASDVESGRGRCKSVAPGGCEGEFGSVVDSPDASFSSMHSGGKSLMFVNESLLPPEAKYPKALAIFDTPSTKLFFIRAVEKRSDKGKWQKRVVALTLKALVLAEHSGKVKRFIRYEHIGSITYQSVPNKMKGKMLQFLVSVPSENLDLLFQQTPEKENASNLTQEAFLETLAQLGAARGSSVKTDAVTGQDFTDTALLKKPAQHVKPFERAVQQRESSVGSNLNASRRTSSWFGGGSRGRGSSQAPSEGETRPRPKSHSPVSALSPATTPQRPQQSSLSPTGSSPNTSTSSFAQQRQESNGSVIVTADGMNLEETLRLLHRVETQEEWDGLQAKHKVQHPMSLALSIKKTFPQEIPRFEEVLRQKGIVFEDVYTNIEESTSPALNPADLPLDADNVLDGEELEELIETFRPEKVSTDMIAVLRQLFGRDIVLHLRVVERIDEHGCTSTRVVTVTPEYLLLCDFQRVVKHAIPLTYIENVDVSPGPVCVVNITTKEGSGVKGLRVRTVRHPKNSDNAQASFPVLLKSLLQKRGIHEPPGAAALPRSDPDTFEAPPASKALVDDDTEEDETEPCSVTGLPIIRCPEPLRASCIQSRNLLYAREVQRPSTRCDDLAAYGRHVETQSAVLSMNCQSVFLCDTDVEEGGCGTLLMLAALKDPLCSRVEGRMIIRLESDADVFDFILDGAFAESSFLELLKRIHQKICAAPAPAAPAVQAAETAAAAVAEPTQMSERQASLASHNLAAASSSSSTPPLCLHASQDGEEPPVPMGLEKLAPPAELSHFFEQYPRMNLLFVRYGEKLSSHGMRQKRALFLTTSRLILVEDTKDMKVKRFIPLQAITDMTIQKVAGRRGILNRGEEEEVSHILLRVPSEGLDLLFIQSYDPRNTSHDQDEFPSVLKKAIAAVGQRIDVNYLDAASNIQDLAQLVKTDHYKSAEKSAAGELERRRSQAKPPLADDRERYIEQLLRDLHAETTKSAELQALVDHLSHESEASGESSVLETERLRARVQAQERELEALRAAAAAAPAAGSAALAPAAEAEGLDAGFAKLASDAGLTGDDVAVFARLRVSRAEHLADVTVGELKAVLPAPLVRRLLRSAGFKEGKTDSQCCEKEKADVPVLAVPGRESDRERKLAQKLRVAHDVNKAQRETISILREQVKVLKAFHSPQRQMSQTSSAPYHSPATCTPPAFHADSAPPAAAAPPAVDAAAVDTAEAQPAQETRAHEVATPAVPEEDGAAVGDSPVHRAAAVPAREAAREAERETSPHREEADAQDAAPAVAAEAFECSNAGGEAAVREAWVEAEGAKARKVSVETAEAEGANVAAVEEEEDTTVEEEIAGSDEETAVEVEAEATEDAEVPVREEAKPAEAAETASSSEVDTAAVPEAEAGAGAEMEAAEPAKTEHAAGESDAGAAAVAEVESTAVPETVPEGKRAGAVAHEEDSQEESAGPVPDTVEIAASRLRQGGVAPIVPVDDREESMAPARPVQTPTLPTPASSAYGVCDNNVHTHHT